MSAVHLRLALETAVRAGGDTDTVAAISGSLLGARWGVTAVPFAWRRRLHGRRDYTQPPLHIADLERLARLASRGGPDTPPSWPAIESMLPHYHHNWPDQPRRTTVAGVEFGNVHALPDALAAGADTVISLCRMGTNDVPPDIEHHVLGLLDTTAEENPNTVLLLTDLTDGLHTLTAEGRHVYVHCVQAQNRTPAVAAAWLHRYRHKSAADALDIAADALNRPKPFLAAAVAAIEPPAHGEASTGSASYEARRSLGSSDLPDAVSDIDHDDDDVRLA
jgi:protein-tyrosine phosphatase